MINLYKMYRGTLNSDNLFYDTFKEGSINPLDTMVRRYVYNKDDRYKLVAIDHYDLTMSICIKTKNRVEDIEDDIIQKLTPADMYTACSYALSSIKGRWLSLEPVIAKTPSRTIYASVILDFTSNSDSQNTPAVIEFEKLCNGKFVNQPGQGIEFIPNTGKS